MGLCHMAACLLDCQMHQMLDVTGVFDASAVKLGMMMMLCLPLLGSQPS